MALTDTAIRNAKHGPTPIKLSAVCNLNGTWRKLPSDYPR